MKFACRQVIADIYNSHNFYAVKTSLYHKGQLHWRSQLHCGIATTSLTYELLLVSTSRFLRRYSCRYGHGRRYGYDTPSRPHWRCGTKDSAMRQLVCFFSDEFGGVKNPRRQRFGGNERAAVGRFARPCFVCARCMVRLRIAFGNFTQRLWRFSYCVGVYNRFSRFENTKGLTKKKECAIIPPL